MTQINRLVSSTLSNRLVLAFLALQLLDAFTTSVGVAWGATELNPLAAWWFTGVGSALGPISLKIMAGLFIVGLLARIQLLFPQARLHWNVMLACNVFYSLVVLNNFKIILT